MPIAIDLTGRAAGVTGAASSLETGVERAFGGSGIRPVGRLGDASDVGWLCAFLANDFARYLSGETGLIDGVRTAMLQREAIRE